MLHVRGVARQTAMRYASSRAGKVVAETKASKAAARKAAKELKDLAAKEKNAAKLEKVANAAKVSKKEPVVAKAVAASATKEAPRVSITARISQLAQAYAPPALVKSYGEMIKNAAKDRRSFCKMIADTQKSAFEEAKPAEMVAESIDKVAEEVKAAKNYLAKEESTANFSDQLNNYSLLFANSSKVASEGLGKANSWATSTAAELKNQLSSESLGKLVEKSKDYANSIDAKGASERFSTALETGMQRAGEESKIAAERMGKTLDGTKLMAEKVVGNAIGMASTLDAKVAADQASSAKKWASEQASKAFDTSRSVLNDKEQFNKMLATGLAASDPGNLLKWVAALAGAGYLYSMDWSQQQTVTAENEPAPETDAFARYPMSKFIYFLDCAPEEQSRASVNASSGESKSVLEVAPAGAELIAEEEEFDAEATVAEDAECVGEPAEAAKLAEDADDVDEPAEAAKLAEDAECVDEPAEAAKLAEDAECVGEPAAEASTMIEVENNHTHSGDKSAQKALSVIPEETTSKASDSEAKTWTETLTGIAADVVEVVADEGLEEGSVGSAVLHAAANLIRPVEAVAA